MKINLYESIGEYSKSCDIEYNSDSETERKETEIYFDKFFDRKTEIKVDTSALAKIASQSP